MVAENNFFNGYALVSALPGPLVSIGSYLGALLGGVPGAICCWTFFAMPRIMLIFAALPFYKMFRNRPVIKKAMLGVNAVSVGIIFTAIYQLWERNIVSHARLVIVVLSFGLFHFWNFATPIVIFIGGLIGLVLSLVKV